MLNISGNFNVPVMQKGIHVKGAQVLKHIVLVVTRSGNYQSVTPFREVVVFKDDVQDSGNSCSGAFNIDLLDHIQFSGEGDYYCLCSIGNYLSNIVKITV
ncbi:MAG: hypothetical protein GY820_05555 [Gammaproteobacteria bacterium]|nr:hypothetical protein [Gammaproteobacteria bacterium]